MTPDAPRPLENDDESKATAPTTASRSRVAGGVVLLVAALAGVAVISFSTQTTAPRGGPATGAAPRTSIIPVPAAAAPAGDLAQPVVVPREHDPSPFDAATTDSAVAGCRDRVAEAVGTDSEIIVAETFGDVDPTKGRADSLIIEGSAGTHAFHCAASHRADGAVADMKFTVEEGWGGVSPGFAAVHAVTVAAEESCMRRVNKMFPGFVFRGVQLERHGDTLHVSGDAFPLDNDLVRRFSCDATVGGGRVLDAAARREK